MSGKGLNDSLVIILEQPIQTWKHKIVPRKRLNLCCPVIRSGNRVLFAGGIIFVSASNISRRISYYLAN